MRAGVVNPTVAVGQNPPLAMTGAAAGTDLITGKVAGDAQNRIVINADGTIEIGNGSTPPDVNLYRAAAQLTTDANFAINTAGNGLRIKEGANAKMGTGVLNGATEVLIATTAVTASSRIFLTIQAPGGTPSGTIYVSSRTAGTNFGVKSAAADTSTFAWLLIEPA